MDSFNRNITELIEECRKNMRIRLIYKIDWQIYVKFYRYIVIWLVPVVLMFGLLGTLLCLVVLIKRRSCMGSNTMRKWLICLSLTDLYSLLFGLLVLYVSRINIMFTTENIQYIKKSDFNRTIINKSHVTGFKHSSRTTCFLINGLVYYGILVSAWVQCSMSLYRAISLGIWKFKLDKAKNEPYEKWYIILSVILPLIVVIILISTTLDYQPSSLCRIYKTCGLKSPFHHVLFFVISLIIKVILPGIILLFSSYVIIHNIQKYQLRISVRIKTLNQSHYKLFKRIRSRRISSVLLCMNISFISLSMPFELYKIYVYFYPPILNGIPQSNYNNIAVLRTIDQSFNIILYFNNATNWIFYCFLGKRFRICLKDQLKLFSDFMGINKLTSGHKSGNGTTKNRDNCNMMCQCGNLVPNYHVETKSTYLKRFKIQGGGSVDLELEMKNGNAVISDPRARQIYEKYRLEPMSNLV